MKKFLSFIILIIIGLFLYARFIGNANLEVKEYIIENENIPKQMTGLKIVHFSDLLYEDDYSKSLLEQTIDTINKQKPDLIIFTGDLLKVKIDDKTKEFIINKLNELNSNIGKYYITGDNDDDITKEMMELSSFKLLDNTFDYIYKDDITPIILIDSHIEDEEYAKIDTSYTYTIGLLHKPDDFDNIDKEKLNLVLAGHCLGGQIRIPFYGPVIKKNGCYTYIDDYYNHDDKIMYVSYGIGTEKTHLRFLDKPSINIYRLLTK